MSFVTKITCFIPLNLTQVRKIAMNQPGTLHYWSVALIAIATLGNTPFSPTESLLQPPASPTQENPSASEINLPLLSPDAASTSSQVTGQVAHYLLNLDGIIEGLVLTNGLQVRFPPHMSSMLASAIKPGDRVSIEGDEGVPSVLGQEIRADRITNLQTKAVVTELPPGATGPQVLTTTDYAEFNVTGTADYWLVGYHGEIRGIVLSTGVQVRFSPELTNQLYAIAKTGVTVEVVGFGSSNDFGEVIEATSLTVDGQPIAPDTRMPQMRSALPQ